MGKLCILIGKSGTGKDTLSRRLAADPALRLAPVIPYTTRPRRAREEEGAQYHFITESELQAMEARGDVIEKRCYNTVAGLWCYCTGRFELEDDRSYIVITTPAALPRFAAVFGRENLVLLLLTAPDRVRLDRALRREERQETPRYDEVCRRYLADEADFAQLDESVCGTFACIATEGAPEETAAAARAALLLLLGAEMTAAAENEPGSEAAAPAEGPAGGAV